MEQKTFPKVAIVSCNPMRADIANGIMMRSLFASWPRDCLTQIYFPVGADYPPEFDSCQDYRRINWLGEVQRLETKLSEASKTTEIAKLEVSSESRTRYQTLVALKQRKHVFKWSKCAQEIWYANSWIGRALRKQIEDCQPDIVYALLGNYSLAKNTFLACMQVGVPLYLHITDDYVRSLYQSMPFGKVLAATSDKWLRQCVAYSSGRAGISPTMAEEYQERYRKPWDTFTTGASPESYDPTPRRCDGITRFVYAGNLGLGRWKQLRALAVALNEMSAKSSSTLSLEIYSSQEQVNAHRESLELAPVVKLRGWVPMEELPKVFHQADVLVHVESFEKEVIALTRLSLSTKLYQYMMAGRCLLGIGPEDLASMKLIRQSNAGVIFSANPSHGLKETIQNTFLSDETRLNLGRNGRTWAERWGDCRLERERFRKSLEKAFLSSRHQQA